MFIVIPEIHKFEKGESPTLTTIESDEVKLLDELAPCKNCGLSKKGSWHKMEN